MAPATYTGGHDGVMAGVFVTEGMETARRGTAYSLPQWRPATGCNPGTRRGLSGEVDAFPATCQGAAAPGGSVPHPPAPGCSASRPKHAREPDTAASTRSSQQTLNRLEREPRRSQIVPDQRPKQMVRPERTRSAL